MNWTAEEFTKLLSKKVETFDKQGATALCNALITEFYQTQAPFPSKEAEKILQILRNKRFFELMQMVGDALIQTDRYTFKIYRQYAQSLIDLGNLTAAIAILENLISSTELALEKNTDAAGENVEAKGLTGRVYKQLYVNANNPSNPQNKTYLEKAIGFYLDVYTSAPQTYLWHGINVVALLQRAQKDDVTLTDFPDSQTIAQNIQQEIEDKHGNKEADTWNFATAMEACVALNKTDEALAWINLYINAPYVDAFELASTLRQLTEVWQLDMTSEIGKKILPILRAELLKKEGGEVVINPNDLLQQRKEESSTTAKYEKVFGDESFNSYKWYMKGADRCLGIARIGRDASQGIGTGFLLKGSMLHEKLGDDPLLITNAHVVCDDVQVEALRSYEAVIIFEALEREQEFKAGTIIWSSPPHELDVTIIQFLSEDINKLKELTHLINPYPIARVLPLVEPSQRVYVIGHPGGGTLQLSLQDNALLDHQDPRIHYRTPTLGGSSGSPIFNRQWDLLGIHHLGEATMPMLNGKKGTYEANEGIWIRTIMKELTNFFNDT